MLPNLGRLALNVPHVGPRPEGTATIPLGTTTVQGADTETPTQIVGREPVMECPICIGEIQLFHPDTYVLACASEHAYHLGCLQRANATASPAMRNRCPECKQQLTPATRVRLEAPVQLPMQVPATSRAVLAEEYASSVEWRNRERARRMAAALAARYEVERSVAEVAAARSMAATATATAATATAAFLAAAQAAEAAEAVAVAREGEAVEATARAATARAAVAVAWAEVAVRAAAAPASAQAVPLNRALRVAVMEWRDAEAAEAWAEESAASAEEAAARARAAATAAWAEESAAEAEESAAWEEAEAMAEAELEEEATARARDERGDEEGRATRQRIDARPPSGGPGGHQR